MIINDFLIIKFSIESWFAPRMNQKNDYLDDNLL